MKELLSNEEIDTLLDMFRSEESALVSDADLPKIVASEVKESVVNPVDLLKPNRMSREQMRAFELWFEPAAKSLASTMTDKLRYEMSCDCVAVEQIRFQQWIDMAGKGSGIYILNAKPLEGPVLFSLTTSLLYGAVDRILGGLGKVTNVPAEFSEAEYTVADAFVEPCLQRIADAMGEVLPDADWQIADRFSNPSLAQILGSQDVVLSVHFQAGSDFLLGDLRLAIPFNALEPHLVQMHKDKFKSESGDSPLRDVISDLVRSVDVEMAVQLGETSIPLRSLLSLSEGDVVPLKRRLGEHLIAPVQGVPKFKGKVGTSGNRLAYQVVEVMET